MKNILISTFAIALSLTATQAVFANAPVVDVASVTISFSEDSTLLSQADKDSLQSLFNTAEQRGYTTDKITIAAWSDQDLPPRGASLTDADENLASARADAIAAYAKANLSITTVQEYNMAESSNWLARTFNTKDAKLKSVFSKRMASTPVTNSAFRMIRHDGGASKAVVVIEAK